jgi:hypothetical protein
VSVSASHKELFLNLFLHIGLAYQSLKHLRVALAIDKDHLLGVTTTPPGTTDTVTTIALKGKGNEKAHMRITRKKLENSFRLTQSFLPTQMVSW